METSEPLTQLNQKIIEPFMLKQITIIQSKHLKHYHQNIEQNLEFCNNN